MSALQWLGAAICALPFVAVFLVVAATDGARAAAGIFLAVAVVVGVILFGSYLATGGAL